jgi:hypothetical protein
MMRRRLTVSPVYGEVKSRILAAFKELRKNGKLLCRSNFWCCQSCAGYDITLKAQAIVDKGKVVNGCVFWHKQDEDRFRSTGTVYLAFGQMNSEKHGVIGLEDELVGQMVCDRLKANGLEYEWDGTGNQRILVKGVRDERLD